MSGMMSMVTLKCRLLAQDGIEAGICAWNSKSYHFFNNWRKMPTLEQLYDIFASVFLIFCPTRCAETGLSTPYIFIKLIPCICFICHVEGQSNLIEF
jgi:hypothetical protein